MSVLPQLRIDVLHIPAERFAVQLPPQSHALCNAANTGKHVRRSSREEKMEKNERDV